MISTSTSPAEPDSESRAMRAVIEDVLDALDHPGCCCFALCPGPDREHVNMATCRVCTAVIGLRGVLAGTIVFDSARERLAVDEGAKP